MKIERIEGDIVRKGWRYSDDEYAFYDVYYMMVSGHYLIEECSRRKQYRTSLPPKDVFGPLPLEIIEGDIPEEEVDRKCLGRLESKFRFKAVEKHYHVPEPTQPQGCTHHR
ncbi:MAG: hypothetical protein HY367_02480 [Candidatus Aenigmarchaeota archaeon]|nr:hypothetical protein [Candidatus Aenigmarchaeota archaeon]